MNPSRSTSRRSKDSRRINSRKPSSSRTGFRAAKRGAHEDLAAPAQNAAQPSAAASGDRLSAAAVPPPHSLQTRAGRQDWEAVLRLLVKIRIDGDAAAARLGDASPQHDGLAAVEYIATKILAAVAGERRQQIATAADAAAKQHATATARAGSPHPQPKPRNQVDPRPAQPPPAPPARPVQQPQPGPPAPPASHSSRSQLISELRQMLRDGKTKTGAVIDSQLAHEIAKHITTLNEAVAQSETAQSIKRLRERLARLFGKGSGQQAATAATAAAAAAATPKRAKTTPLRSNQSNKPKQTVTRRTKSSKAGKRAKRRSR